MAGVATGVLGIGVYTFFLLRTEAWPLGIFWLIFFALLALALLFMSRREYRRLRQIGSIPPSSGVLQPSPLAVESQLRKLRPHLRVVSFLILGVVWVAWSLPLAVAHGLEDRLTAMFPVFPAIVGTFIWKREQRIVRDFAVSLATITRVQGSGRQRRAYYDFSAVAGRPVQGAARKGGYEEGMTVPVLYRRTKPAENSAVTDFLFYRIGAEG